MTHTEKLLRLGDAIRDAEKALSVATQLAKDELLLEELDFLEVRTMLAEMARCVGQELPYKALSHYLGVVKRPRQKPTASSIESRDRRRRAGEVNGKKGGRSKSFAKQSAARENGRLGGRPRKPLF